MTEFFNFIHEFFTKDIFDFFSQAFEYMGVLLMTNGLELITWLLDMSFTIFSSVVSTFDISGSITSAMSSVPSDIQSYLFFFRIPEVITNLLGGLAGRFVLKLIPGI